jgi:hypothetical protein
MTTLTERQKKHTTLASIIVDHELLEMWRIPGDPLDTVRLSYASEPDDEIGRVVDLTDVKPRLATSLAVWSSDMRLAVLLKVRDEYSFVAAIEGAVPA